MLKTWQALPLGGAAIHQRILEEIQKKGTVKKGEKEFEKYDKEEDLTENTLEDIKVRLCCVTDTIRGHQIQQINQDASSVSALSSFLKKSVPASDYILNGETVLKVDGQTREGVCEVLFEQDGDRLSVPTMILDALLASPIDTRKELAANIVIVGGTSMQLGFKARLFQEMEALMKEEYYSERLKIMDFKLHIPLGQANFAAWTGASIFGATDAITTRSFTREQFTKDKCVPDWSNLRYNSVYNNSDSSEQRQG